jgi:hypothetical protein
MSNGFPKTGDTVYWADKKTTTLNLEGVDLNGPFPNTDEAFFRIFGENWATKPDEFAGVRGVRQSLIVDSETITSGVSRLMEEMVEGDNEWDLPPFPQQSHLLRYVIAATKFDAGWAGSAERAKYLPNSVGTDPVRPGKPPIVDPELARLRQQLADAMAERERLKDQNTKLDSQVQDLQKQLAEKPAGGGDEELRKALGKEVNRARGVLGKKPAGKWWQEMKKTVDAVAKLAE